MRVLVDMDSVLADFETGFLALWRATYPDRPFLPLEERRIFYLEDEYPPEDRDRVQAIFRGAGFFRNLPPVPGGAAALAEMEARGLEVFICTTPMIHYQNCVLEKYEWVEAHLGPAWTERLILTRDKTLVRADILIDDRPEIAGVETPTWEHVLYDQPYNRAVNGKRRLTWATWQAVLLGE
jgi:5'-nucleotidase